jgi:hypothetical protein
MRNTVFCGIPSFKKVFTRATVWLSSWTRQIQFTFCVCISSRPLWILSLDIRLVPTGSPIPPDFVIPQQSVQNYKHSFNFPSFLFSALNSPIFLPLQPRIWFIWGFIQLIFIGRFISLYKNQLEPCDKWVPVTTAWRVLRLRMEERPPMWRVTANILNKQSRTVKKRWSSSLGVGQGAKNSFLLKRILLRNIHRQSLGPGLILWYELSKERRTWVLVLGVLGDCIGKVHLQQQPGNWLDIN